MTKEEQDKLIELSDLNREDNVKYKSSEAQGIAIALNSDMYAPTLCKLERAYICGRRKSEKRVSELEKENEKLKTKKIPQLERKIASIRGAHSVDCKKLNARTEQVERLKKENAELKEKVGKYQIGMFDEIEKRDKRLTKAKAIIESLLAFEYVIDPYALTSDIEENQKRFHEPFRRAEQFLKEV